MKKQLFKAALLAALGLASVTAAQAATPNPGDLVLGFTQSSGNPSGNDYVIDLGSSFLGTSGVTDLSSLISLTTFNSTFSSVSAVNAGVVGGINTGGDGTEVWLTSLRNGSPASVTIPGTETKPSKITLSGNLSGAAAVAGSVLLGTPSQTDTGLGSWTQQIAKSPTLAGANTHNFVSYIGSSGNPLRNIGTSGILIEDLWTESNVGGTLSAMTYDGFFTLDMTGSTPVFTYTGNTVAVPEPMSYGLLSGAGLLLLSLRRQFIRA